MFTLNDIVQGNGPALSIQSNTTPDPKLVFRAAHHDSRQIEQGDLFVAIKGVNVDGHRFIPAAIKSGALAVLCTMPVEDVPPDFLQIVVPDVIVALQATARVRVQRQQDTTLLGITGSNGKTSTKDAVAAVLGRKAPTLKTQASYNNELGYPLTLLSLEAQHRYAVLEMGAQWVGELVGLSHAVAKPDWSLITNIGASHLEYFGSQERVTIAKTELVQVLSTKGVALLNYDDVNVRGMRSSTQARILFYGQGEGAEVRATDIGDDALFGRSFTLHYSGQQQHVQLHFPGEHGITIALAAAAAGCAAEMPLQEIASALEALPASKGRGEIKPGPNGSVIIDDTYNANRQSILAITQAMHNTRHTGKRWAVLGDIFELGPYAKNEHITTGAALTGNIDYLVALGDKARYYVEGAIAAGMPQQHTYFYNANVESKPELEAAKRAIADLLKYEVRPDDLVLLKGSRGMQIETLLTML